MIVTLYWQELSYRKRWPRDAPYLWVFLKFSWVRPQLLLPKFLISMHLFRSILWMCVGYKIWSSEFTHSCDNRGYSNSLDSPWIRPRSHFSQICNVLLFGWTPWIYLPDLKCVARVSEMVPFERALISSYRPSIVTFHLSLRISEILPLLCFSAPLFPTSPLVSPNFPVFT